MRLVPRRGGAALSAPPLDGHDEIASIPSSGSYLASVFTGYDFANGYELWTTDGTTAGTVLQGPAAGFDDPAHVTILGSRVHYMSRRTVGQGYARTLAYFDVPTGPAAPAPPPLPSSGADAGASSSSGGSSSGTTPPPSGSGGASSSSGAAASSSGAGATPAGEEGGDGCSSAPVETRRALGAPLAALVAAVAAVVARRRRRG